MNEESLLHALKRRDEAALEQVIDRYSAYVSTIIHNIIGSAMTTADVEEVASDVFFALWSNADKVNPGKLKAYLSGVARNKAKDKLRANGSDIPLDDDIVIISDVDLERDIEEHEQAQLIKRAVLDMQYPEREIFLRYYYYYQTIAQISEEMHINVSTVKTKLRRGRQKLREFLSKGGYNIENEDFGHD